MLLIPISNWQFTRDPSTTIHDLKSQTLQFWHFLKGFFCTILALSDGYLLLFQTIFVQQAILVIIIIILKFCRPTYLLSLLALGKLTCKEQCAHRAGTPGFCSKNRASLFKKKLVKAQRHRSICAPLKFSLLLY